MRTLWIHLGKPDKLSQGMPTMQAAYQVRDESIGMHSSHSQYPNRGESMSEYKGYGTEEWDRKRDAKLAALTERNKELIRKLNSVDNIDKKGMKIQIDVLRAEIEALKKKLKQKDAEIFDLTCALATTKQKALAAVTERVEKWICCTKTDRANRCDYCKGLTDALKILREMGK